MAGLKLKQRPESLSGNPLLDRYPEPPRGGVRPPFPWGKLLAGILLILIAVGGVFFVPRFLRQEDPAPWQRAGEWLDRHGDAPPPASALAGLKDVIRVIPRDAANDDVRAALMALYGLGSLQAGAASEWRATVGVMQRDVPESQFVERVRGVTMMLSVRVPCSRCDGTGRCPNCEGKGQRETPSLARRPAGGRREIGGSLAGSSTGTCPVCKGTGRCRDCDGTGKVSRAPGVPTPDKADLNERWRDVAADAVNLVRLRYWKAKGTRGLSDVRDILISDDSS